MAKRERVLILGASPNRKRYAYLARALLAEHSHDTVLVNPGHDQIEGQRCYRTLTEATAVTTPIDTLTMYVSPARSDALKSEILSVPARRIIFNPGTENDSLAEELRRAGREVVYGCTLVMLRTGSF